MIKNAEISPDRLFRYNLTRIWHDNWEPVKLLHVVMLNPSTADAEQDDPTIKRLMHRAKAEGFNGIVVNNLYAFRSTYPSFLLNRWSRGYDVIGPENNDRIFAATVQSGATLVAWGCHVLACKRDQKVMEMLYVASAGRSVYCVGLTSDGYPKHPLHVAYAQTMFKYTGRFSR